MYSVTLIIIWTIGRSTGGIMFSDKSSRESLIDWWSTDTGRDGQSMVSQSHADDRCSSSNDGGLRIVSIRRQQCMQNLRTVTTVELPVHWHSTARSSTHHNNKKLTTGGEQRSQLKASVSNASKVHHLKSSNRRIIGTNHIYTLLYVGWYFAHVFIEHFICSFPHVQIWGQFLTLSLRSSTNNSRWSTCYLIICHKLTEIC